MLQHVAEYDAKTIGDQRRIYELIKSNDRTLTNIRRLSDGLAVASRHRYSTNTFIKVLFLIVNLFHNIFIIYLIINFKKFREEHFSVFLEMCYV